MSQSVPRTHNAPVVQKKSLFYGANLQRVCLPPPLFTCMNELNPLFLKEEEKRQKLQSYIWRTPLPIPPVLKMKKKDRVAERFAINRTFCDYLHSIVVRNSVITSLRLSLSGGQ